MRDFSTSFVTLKGRKAEVWWVKRGIEKLKKEFYRICIFLEAFEIGNGKTHGTLYTPEGKESRTAERRAFTVRD